MDKFKISLLQIAPTETLDGNLAKGIDACKKAKKLGADLAVFPEMWSNGYERIVYDFDKPIDQMPPNKVKHWQSKAVAETSDFVTSFSKLAKELEMAIAITFLEKSKRQPLNTIIVFDRFGKKVLKYQKVHTVDGRMEFYIDGGKNFPVGELDFGRGKVKIGSLICFDRCFPEASRTLMLNGAEIIIIPNACHIYEINFAELKIRAYENALVTLMVNYPIESRPMNSGNRKSCAYHPMYLASKRYIKDSKDRDTEIIRMGEKEEIAVIEIDLAEVREQREYGGQGNAYRKPKTYGKLLCKKVNDPFKRKFARR